MYQRAPRVTFVATSGTPAKVGPGSYDVSPQRYRAAGWISPLVIYDDCKQSYFIYLHVKHIAMLF